MNTVPCHCCGSEQDETFLEALGYRIAQCMDCGLWFVNPQPTRDELAEFYSAYDEGEVWQQAERHFNQEICKTISKLKPGGTILDIGCGAGNFLRTMQDAGFSVFGVEPSQAGNDLPIYHGMLEDYLGTDNRQFDVITMLNVFEHLTNPTDTLHQLRGMLAPGGIIVIVVPDARFHNFIGRLRQLTHIADPYSLHDKGFLAAFRVPEHLCAFTPSTITSLLQRCGFSVVTITSAPVIFNRGLRTIAKLALFWLSKTIHVLTFKRVLIGYSTLVIARSKIPSNLPT